MNSSLPESLLAAQKSGVEYFQGEDAEWRLEFKEPVKSIEELAGGPVCIFANNGYGDYLFLKRQPDGSQWADEVFTFYHEGPEITRVPENLETLLGLKERPPAHDDYPQAIYETGEAVQLGDRVQIKVWAEFWKGWQDGVVKYVPGISKKKPAYEHGGLKEVGISIQHGEICPLVDPKTGKLRKVKFIARNPE